MRSASSICWVGGLPVPAMSRIHVYRGAVVLAGVVPSRDAIVRARRQGLSRILVGFKMLDRSIPRHGYGVVCDGRPVGTVTSGNVSFTLGYNIGMAYLQPALAEPGSRVGIDVRGTAAPAEVVALPFYKRLKT